jgi:hypothetical protein
MADVAFWNDPTHSLHPIGLFIRPNAQYEKEKDQNRPVAGQIFHARQSCW